MLRWPTSSRQSATDLAGSKVPQGCMAMASLRATMLHLCSSGVQVCRPWPPFAIAASRPSRQPISITSSGVTCDRFYAMTCRPPTSTYTRRENSGWADAASPTDTPNRRRAGSPTPPRERAWPRTHEACRSLTVDVAGGITSTVITTPISPHELSPEAQKKQAASPSGRWVTPTTTRT